MKSLCVFIFLVCSSFSSKAQSGDTAYQYYNIMGKECLRDSSFSFIKQYSTENNWIRERYFTKTNQLSLRQTYLDKDYKVQQGNVDQFFEDGRLKARYFFNNNKVVWGKFFYANGKLNGTAGYDANGLIVNQEGYDTSGNKIKGYIFDRESDFKGGQQGWITYLQSNLKNDLPSQKGAPTGKYTVVLSFVIGVDGKLSEVTASSDPGYGTKEEAIRVLEKGPKWIPAIQNGKFVLSRKRQAISFLVQ